MVIAPSSSCSPLSDMGDGITLLVDPGYSERPITGPSLRTVSLLSRLPKGVDDPHDEFGFANTCLKIGVRVEDAAPMRSNRPA